MVTSLERTKTHSTILGHRITVFAGDHIGRRIRRYGMYEKGNVLFFLALLKHMDRPLVFDIGANIGNHTLAFSTVAGQVHAFEPLPQVFSVLETNLRQNRIENVTAHNLALSDIAGQAELFVDLQGNVGGSSLEPKREDMQGVKVQKERGDELVSRLGLARIDFIKIDVEGHEASVLAGLKESIERFRPVIALEWSDETTIRQMSDSGLMAWLLASHDAYVLCSTHERSFWEGVPFSTLRRKWARLHKPQTALHAFDPGKRYRNVLLIPVEKAKGLPPDFDRALDVFAKRQRN